MKVGELVVYLKNCLDEGVLLYDSDVVTGDYGENIEAEPVITTRHFPTDVLERMRTGKGVTKNALRFARIPKDDGLTPWGKE